VSDSAATRAAVVTGGAHGIGAAVARRLVRAGHRVLILDRERAEDCAPTLHVDLADAAAVQAAAADATQRLGRVDILVSCAGISEVSPLLGLDLDSYHRVLAVNLHAPVLLMRELTPAMTAAGFGRVVNITSVHAQVSEPGCLAYDVAKGGLSAATRTAAIELAGSGVLVNAVAPGFVATRMSVVDGADELESDWFRTVYLQHGQLPIGRAAHPDEIAETVGWLASDANTYLTGQCVTVDGGLTVRL
jgi:NAD(P)-dependent dehydrogenase (short-subunit alcohol dehydrogenase family)